MTLSGFYFARRAMSMLILNNDNRAKIERLSDDKFIGVFVRRIEYIFGKDVHLHHDFYFENNQLREDTLYIFQVMPNDFPFSISVREIDGLFVITKERNVS